VRRQINKERDGDPRPQHGGDPILAAPGGAGLVQNRRRPPLQRGGAGHRGGGRDVETVHRRHAARRIGRAGLTLARVSRSSAGEGDQRR
jgi:hypothetical protein